LVKNGHGPQVLMLATEAVFHITGPISS